MQADKLLGPEIADVDGVTETRSGTISVFNGPAPTIQTFDNEEAEIEGVAAWLKERLEMGCSPKKSAFLSDPKRRSPGPKLPWRLPDGI